MGIEHQVVSGTGFSGLESDEAGIGDSSTLAFNYTPIARWTQIPGDCISTKNPNGDPDPHFYVGVMAYHANNIKEVEFKLNGGAGVIVTEQEINPQTNLPEYFVKIDKNDILDKMNGDKDNPDYTIEKNLELRAIVRPNCGQVKIMQHDVAGVSGNDGSYLMGKHWGVSGGITGSYFFEKRLHPGQHSFFANVKREEDIPTVYMSPMGQTYDPDNWDGTTRERPVNHTLDAARALRGLINSKVASGNLPANRQYTKPGSASGNYVDFSDGRIIMLSGEYDVENYTASFHGPAGSGIENPGKVGNGTDFTNGKPLTRNSFVKITGDPSVSRDQIILESKDPTRTQGDNAFDVWNTEKTVGMQRYEHFRVIRQIKPEEGVELGPGEGTYFTIDAEFLEQDDFPEKPPMNFFQLNDIETKEMLILQRRIDANIRGGAKAYTNCKMTGLYRPASPDIQINNTFSKAADDQSITCLSVGNTFTGSWPSYMYVREIRFPADSDYAKFNGFYTNPSHVEAKPWITTVSEAFRTTGITWPSYEPSQENVTANTIWRRINTKPGNLFVQQFKPGFWRLDDKFEITEPLSDAGLNDSYAEIAQSYGSADYFSKPYYLNLSKPLTTIRDRETNGRRDDGIITQFDAVGNPAIPYVNDLDYYDNIWMTQVMHENDGTAAGFTATGMVLADFDKPLVFGPDSDPFKQKFLFRQGITKPQSSTSTRRQVGEANFAMDSGKNTEAYYAWAEGFTTTPNPNQGHKGINGTGGPIGVFGNPIESLIGVTNDAYPEYSIANTGNDDSFFHLDMYQNWQHGPLSGTILGEGINRLENVLVGYNKWTHCPGQQWNFGNNHYDIERSDRRADFGAKILTVDTGSGAGNFSPGEIVYQGFTGSVDGSYIDGDADIDSDGGVTWTAKAVVRSYDSGTGKLDVVKVRGREGDNNTSTALREDLQTVFIHDPNAFITGSTIYGESSGAARNINSSDPATTTYQHPMEAWRDWAFVSNIFGTPTEYGTGSGTMGVPAIRHLLFYCNTMDGQPVNFKIGSGVYGPEAETQKVLDSKSEYLGLTGGIGYMTYKHAHGYTAGGYSAERYLELTGLNEKDERYRGIVQAEYLEHTHGSAVALSGITIDRGADAIVFRGNFISKPRGSFFQYANRSRGPIRAGDEAGLTAGLEGFDIQDNYYWPYSPKTNDLTDGSVFFFRRLEAFNGPLWENLHPEYGGSNFDSNFNDSWNITKNSGLIAGAGTTVTTAVPFDINRKKKPSGRSSAGADSPEDPASYESTVFTTNNLSVPFSTILAESGIDPSTLYGKAIKIQAQKDGEVIMSTNFVRMQSLPSLETPPVQDISDIDEYEFNRDGANSRVDYKSYIVEDEIQQNPDTGEEEEIQIAYMNSYDWLAADYGVHAIRLNGSNPDGQLQISFSPLYEAGSDFRPALPFSPPPEDTSQETRSEQNRDGFTSVFRQGSGLTLGITFDVGLTLEISSNGTTIGSSGSHPKHSWINATAYHCGTPYNWPNDLVTTLFGGSSSNNATIQRPSGM